MTRSIVSPEGLDFDSPGRRDYFVKLEHTSIWAHHLIPVTVIVGPKAEKGRGLLATGSTHGDEIEGPAALKHLLREIRTGTSSAASSSSPSSTSWPSAPTGARRPTTAATSTARFPATPAAA
jgi:hypothetical protein